MYDKIVLYLVCDLNIIFYLHIYMNLLMLGIKVVKHVLEVIRNRKNN